MFLYERNILRNIFSFLKKKGKVEWYQTFKYDFI